MKTYDVYPITEANVDFWRAVSQHPEIEPGNHACIPHDGSEPKIIENLEFPSGMFAIPSFLMMHRYRDVQMEIADE